ncbi:hypothetical protein ACFUC1_17965 [Pedococcus sp. NPDC057267]|uniref:hypothetical protein n=1 Tax=Pedococcus sp. NPDC057267 TaxID=3346077 RepID=UPI00362DF705
MGGLIARATIARGSPRPPFDGVASVPFVGAGMVGFGLIVWFSAALTLSQADLATPLSVGVAAVASLAAVISVNASETSLRTKLMGAVPVVVMLVASTVRALHDGPTVDVAFFLQGAADALAHGSDPYAVVFRDLYDPSLSSRLYGPGVVEGGVLTYGFPYPPLIALTATIGGFLGDARLAGVAALAAASLMLLALARRPAGRAAAISLVCTPGVGLLLAVGWTESISILLLACVVVAVHRGHLATAAVCLGLLFVSKQYFAVLLPLLWLLRPYATPRRWLLVCAVPLVTTLPFIAWNPGRFWRSVVEWQFIQPYRPDASSLSVVVIEHFHLAPPSWLGPTALLLGFAVACVLAWRLPPSVASFSLAVALSLGAMVLLSKQAFLNYFFLVGAALLVAGWSLSEGRGSVDAVAAASIEEGTAVERRDDCAPGRSASPPPRAVG